MKRLLDIGFRNFVIPFVQNADEARAAVAATRYPPAGIRGVAGAMRAADFGHAPGYHKTANDSICIIVQVETADAVAQLDEIGAVDGVDAIFVGPADLAASMGHLGNFGHAEVQKTIKRVADACARLGKTAGILALDPKDAKRYLKWGFRFIGVASDVGLINAGAAVVMARFRGS
jgi:2-keto-3-deoxy-L-rhamnonate aldolase RhmA